RRVGTASGHPVGRARSGTFACRGRVRHRLLIARRVGTCGWRTAYTGIADGLVVPVSQIGRPHRRDSLRTCTMASASVPTPPTRSPEPARERKIVVAHELGYCWGVRRALDIIQDSAS